MPSSFSSFLSELLLSGLRAAALSGPIVWTRRRRKQKAGSEQGSSLTPSLLIVRSEQVSPCGTRAWRDSWTARTAVPSAPSSPGWGQLSPPQLAALTLRVTPLQGMLRITVSFPTLLSPRLYSEQACMLQPPMATSPLGGMLLTTRLFSLSGKIFSFSKVHGEQMPHASWAGHSPFQ